MMNEQKDSSGTLIKEVFKEKLKIPNLDETKISGKRSKYIILAVLLLMCGITLYAASGIIGAGAETLSNSYNAAYASEKSLAYQEQYDKYFVKAEKNYHVSNRVAISIGDLKEIAKLEVLKVSDVEYIVEDSSDNSNGITSWLEVPGQGTYVVDLQAAEFITDDERAYVKVRAPYPELTNISIDYANVKKMFFKNDILNDSYKVGEELAQRQLNSADMLIKKEFASNERFYLSAQDAAVSTIQCLVRQLNPQNTDMIVEVEFY